MSNSNSKKWSGKTRGGSFGYRFFIFLIDTLGVRFAYFFLAFVVIYFIPFAPKATAASWWYARHILKKNRLQAPLFLFRNYYRFGQTLIDKVAIASGNKDKYQFDFDSTYPQFLQILNQQNGAIMIGAHVGSWEIGAPFFDEYGKKMHVAMLDAEYRKIKKILDQRNDAKNYQILPLSEKDGMSNIFRVKEILDKREYICFQGDRFLGNSQVVKTIFFGKKAQFPIGPFILASRLQVPVIFYFAMRNRKMKYKFHFYIAQPPANGNAVKPEMQLLQQYTKALESILTRYPEQWFNYYRFWE